MQIDHRGTNDNNKKLGQRGSGRGHVTYFCSIGSQILYIFETHGIGQTPSSLERYLVIMKLQLLNVQFSLLIVYYFHHLPFQLFYCNALLEFA